jgi:hypothetical protein
MNRVEQRPGREPSHKGQHATDEHVNREIDEVWFDRPLDGFWSDLTATFWIREVDGFLLLQLDQIHAM